MSNLLTNIRSSKVFYQDGHHFQDGHPQITTLFIVYEIGSQQFLLDRIWALNIDTGYLTQADLKNRYKLINKDDLKSEDNLKN